MTDDRKVLYEWKFNRYICRVIESEPGIVHFEQGQSETGDPSIMQFVSTSSPMGAANEIIQLNMALAEQSVINRELSSAIQRWQEERNRLDREMYELRNAVTQYSKGEGRG